jgi:hypothetical protein
MTRTSVGHGSFPVPAGAALDIVTAVVPKAISSSSSSSVRVHRNGTYVVYLVAQDAAETPNVQAWATPLVFTTLDITPPVFLAGYPRVASSSLGETQMRFEVAADESCTVSWVVRADNDGAGAALTSAEIEARARGEKTTEKGRCGQSGSLHLKRLLSSGSITPFTSVVAGSVKCLAVRTNYTLFFTATDGFGNHLALPRRLSFATILDDIRPHYTAGTPYVSVLDRSGIGLVGGTDLPIFVDITVTLDEPCDLFWAIDDSHPWNATAHMGTADPNENTTSIEVVIGRLGDGSKAAMGGNSNVSMANVRTTIRVDVSALGKQQQQGTLYIAAQDHAVTPNVATPRAAQFSYSLRDRVAPAWDGDAGRPTLGAPDPTGAFVPCYARLTKRVVVAWVAVDAGTGHRKGSLIRGSAAVGNKVARMSPATGGAGGAGGADAYDATWKITSLVGGRTYAIDFTATDESGNIVSASLPPFFNPDSTPPAYLGGTPTAVTTKQMWFSSSSSAPSSSSLRVTLTVAMDEPGQLAFVVLDPYGSGPVTLVGALTPQTLFSSPKPGTRLGGSVSGGTVLYSETVTVDQSRQFTTSSTAYGAYGDIYHLFVPDYVQSLAAGETLLLYVAGKDVAGNVMASSTRKSFTTPTWTPAPGSIAPSPSPSPSPSPTGAATGGAGGVLVKATVGIAGITSADIYATGVKAALRSAVAATLSVSPDKVTISGVRQTGTRRLQQPPQPLSQQPPSVAAPRRLLPSVEVTFSIRLSVDEVPAASVALSAGNAASTMKSITSRAETGMQAATGRQYTLQATVTGIAVVDATSGRPWTPFVPPGAPAMPSCDDATGPKPACNGRGACRAAASVSTPTSASTSSSPSSSSTSSTCICSPLFAGSNCERCRMSGVFYPDCGRATVPVLAKPAAKNVMVAQVVWGIQGLKRSGATGLFVTSKMTMSDEAESSIGTPLLSETFDPSNPDAQKFLAWACQNLTLSGHIVQQADDAARCVMGSFKQWCADTKRAFPTKRGSFASDMQTFLKLSQNVDFRQDVGIEKPGTETGTGAGSRSQYARVRWIRASFLSTMSSYAPGFTALPVFNKWEAVVAELKVKGEEACPGCGLEHCFQTAGLWIRMFTEVSAVNGTLYAIIVIAVTAFVAIAIFTGHIRISIVVVYTVLCILATIMALFLALGWTIGIVEAVAVAILLGSSVDYSLHIVEGFMHGGHGVDSSLAPAVYQSEAAEGRAGPNSRKKRASRSLTLVGVSIIHASVTTFLAVVCLLFCTIKIFVQVGLIISFSCIVSFFYASVPLPALLSTVGPERMRRPCMYRAIALAVATVLLGVLLGGAVGLQMSGAITLQNPDGTPWLSRVEL